MEKTCISQKKQTNICCNVEDTDTCSTRPTSKLQSHYRANANPLAIKINLCEHNCIFSAKSLAHFNNLLYLCTRKGF